MIRRSAVALALLMFAGDAAWAELGTPGGQTLGGGTLAVGCGDAFGGIPFFELQTLTVMKKRVICATVEHSADSPCSHVNVQPLSSDYGVLAQISILPNQTKTVCAEGVSYFAVLPPGFGSGTAVIEWRVDRADHSGK